MSANTAADKMPGWPGAGYIEMEGGQMNTVKTFKKSFAKSFHENFCGTNHYRRSK